MKPDKRNTSTNKADGARASGAKIFADGKLLEQYEQEARNDK